MILNNDKVRVVFSKGRILHSSLVHLKAPSPVDQISNCVYKIKCGDCPAEDIGQTARELNTRITENKNRINKLIRSELDYRILLKDSAIAYHALDRGHKIDLKHLEVISRGFKSAQNGLTAETIEIIKSDKAVDRRHGTKLSGIGYSC